MLSNLEATTHNEVLAALADRAVASGYAEPTLVEALIEREREFPTGLPTPTPVAIPHVDAADVRRAAIAIATLSDPVEFVQMGTDDETVAARAVFVLLVPDPKEQIGVLSALMEVLQGRGRRSWMG